MLPQPARRFAVSAVAWPGARFFLLAWLLTHAALCAGAQPRVFDLPRDTADKSLKRFSEQSGLQVVFSSQIAKAATTRAVKGEMLPHAALEAMLADSGLVVVREPTSGAFSVRRETADEARLRRKTAPTSGARATESVKKNESPPHPEPMKRNRLIHTLAATFALVTGSATAAAEGTGTVEGRIQNIATGNYLNNARVTVEGTTLETFTNDFGEYRLPNVPAGQVTVRAAYTGLAPQAARVTVPPGQRVNQDFSLRRGAPRSGADAGDESVVLDAFVVASSKEMSSREIAINEQRFAANLKNVVSADEFGDLAEGNVGEFLKYIPGITVENVGADARSIAVRGLPPLSTAVMVDGAPMASAPSSATRVFELEQVSINNVSRVEVTKSPTPDLPASAVGGAVNMISRSSFERSKPLFNFRTYLNWNTDEGFFRRTRVGPGRGSNVHTNPAFDFSYIRPVNRNFGFTVSGSYSDQYAPDYRARPRWLPGTSGSTLATPDNPFLRNYNTFYGPKVTRRISVGTTLDWRISHGNTLSLGVQWNDYDAFWNNKTGNLDTIGSLTSQAPAAWGSTFTQSRPGAASIDRGGSLLRKTGTTAHTSLKFKHEGPVWKIDAGATYSGSSNHHRSPSKGFPSGYSLSLPNLTLRLDQIDGKLGVPKDATATRANGEAVAWREIAPYRINSINFSEQDARDVSTSARVNAKREFTLPLLATPLVVKAGLDVRRMDRDIRARNQSQHTFVGPDGSSAATSADNLAGLYDLVDDGFHRDGRSGYGEPWMQYVSAHKLYDLFATQPGYFVENTALRIQNEAQTSRKLVETIRAAYVRTDWRLFRNRLWVVAGVRYEHTADDGQGVLVDPTVAYQKDANGRLIRGANNLPIRITGLDAVTIARRQYTDRGARATRSYDGFYPSANAVLNLTENLLLRGSFAKTISRPNLDQIIPGTRISDPNTTNENNLLITVNNTALNPWTSENLDLGLEYYFGRNGGNVLSVGGFRKDIKDFFATRREDATPALLESFGLDDSYLVYDVQYKFNAGDATVTGVELNYRQGLTFLPHWARGLDVFYNVTAQRLQGTTLADFNSFVRRNDNYGVTLSRLKFTLRLKVNDRGRQRQDALRGANLLPGAYRYQAPRRMLDIDFEYRLTRQLSLFAAGRNVTNEPSTHRENYGPGTPEYARINDHWVHGVNYVFGVKGRF